jgi:hypothetical protein
MLLDSLRSRRLLTVFEYPQIGGREMGCTSILPALRYDSSRTSCCARQKVAGSHALNMMARRRLIHVTQDSEGILRLNGETMEG